MCEYCARLPRMHTVHTCTLCMGVGAIHCLGGVESKHEKSPDFHKIKEFRPVETVRLGWAVSCKCSKMEQGEKRRWNGEQ